MAPAPSAISSGGNWKDLLKAAGDGDLAAARYHLRCGGVDPNYQHPEYFTAPIFEAIRAGHLDMVRLLVQGEGDVGVGPSPSSSSTTTTKATTTRANPQLVEELTDMTPLEVALEGGRHAIVDYLNTRLPPEARWHPRRVLVTGGNRGIGRAIVEQLLRQGHAVAFTCRNATAGRAVAEELVHATGNTKLQLVVGDLSTIASTRALGRSILAHPFIPTTLVHNAGLWPTECRINPDLLEQSFMVNYMAPYLLTQMLLPAMIEAATTSSSSSDRDVRVVLVTAGLALYGVADVRTTPLGKDFSRFKTYQNTKQCGLIWCMHQARLQQEKCSSQQKQAGQRPTTTNNTDDNKNDDPDRISVSFNAVHPGVINTGLGEGATTGRCMACLLKVVKKWWKTPAEGAVAPVWLAVSPSARDVRGCFYWEMKPHDLSKHGGAAAVGIDPASQDQWAQWTEDFLARHDGSSTKQQQQ
jgi:NAD(P)-dependent dehydrogenase (short-subunit alcohol dehydrogenase family)